MHTENQGWWLRTPHPSQKLSTGNRILPDSVLSFHRHAGSGGVWEWDEPALARLQSYVFFLCEVCLSAGPQTVRQIPANT